MQSFERQRQYVSAVRLYAMYPLLRFSNERGAYVLRFVGETRGPVLRKDRRRRQLEFLGADRRAGGVNPVLSSRPMGGVRRIEVAAAPRRAVERAEVQTPEVDSAEVQTPDAETAEATPRPPSRQPEAGPANPRRRQDGRQRRPRPHR
jgi:hypothetical protein